MKLLFWIGLTVLILGFTSLIIPIPHHERQGIEAGGVSIGVETRTENRVSPYLSGLMIAGGVGLMIAGKGRKTG